MHETTQAADGYAAIAGATASTRSIEYQLFAKVTRDLADLDDHASDRISKRADAAYKNMRLWTALAADLAHQDNALPAEVKSKLFYLYEFTRQHTSKVLAGTAETAVLVDINKSVMRGLRVAASREEA